MKRIIISVFLILTIALAGCSAKPKEEPKQAQNQTNEQTQNQDSKTQEEEKVKAPDFELKTLGGKDVKLSSLKGKVVVVNFFATWCPPCKAELPGFIATAEKYRDKGVEFLFVDVMESNSTVEKFLKERNFKIDPLIDEAGIVSESYGIRAYPTTFILDKDGYVASAQEGFMDEGALNSSIQKAME